MSLNTFAVDLFDRVYDNCNIDYTRAAEHDYAVFVRGNVRYSSLFKNVVGAGNNRLSTLNDCDTAIKDKLTALMKACGDRYDLQVQDNTDYAVLLRENGVVIATDKDEFQNVTYLSSDVVAILVAVRRLKDLFKLKVQAIVDLRIMVKHLPSVMLKRIAHHQTVIPKRILKEAAMQKQHQTTYTETKLGNDASAQAAARLAASQSVEETLSREGRHQEVEEIIEANKEKRANLVPELRDLFDKIDDRLDRQDGNMDAMLRALTDLKNSVDTLRHNHNSTGH